MNLTPIWGSLTVFIICPLLGGLPLIDWITYTITGRHLSKLGTGNISVSAAFYHGGKGAGILAVLSEAAKGIVAVLLARAFFPAGSVWEIIAIIALVMGRYWMGKSAGTTNAVWGIVAHDAIAAGLVWLISLISFTIIRDRTLGKYGALVLLVVIIGLRNPDRLEYAVATLALASLLAWIYQNIPDDLDLAATTENTSNSKMFRFFQGDQNILTLNNKLDADQVGSKAANLSLLKRQGYSIAEGWILRPGDDLRALVAKLEPAKESPLIVRSSAIGEDSQSASAAGQYLSILDVTTKEQLNSAIIDCQASYLQGNALEYRRHSRQAEESMAILIQRQIAGVYSGVAFSRDPVDRLNDGVAIEALPGKATKIVSGKFTPQRYRVAIPEAELDSDRPIVVTQENLHDDAEAIPQKIIESVAILAREMEDLFEGIPQDIEWTHDGKQLWLLQVRPITNLQPIWTRRIAAEVIPGKIRPLTWSINQPLTCGVWGKLFTIVLGNRAKDLNFNETATLHFASAYFNATLLGTIFRRMGLPPESLEFLTRGAKFSKPPLSSTIRNLPGLWRLFKREWNLIKHFQSDRQSLFTPILTEIEAQEVAELSPPEIIDRINTILELLDKVTYYNILAPLSFALRQSLFKVAETELDSSQTSEVIAVSSLAEIASQARKILGTKEITLDSSASLFAHIAENPEGTSVMEQFNLWLNKYGYLSETATDIAVPRWRDKPGIPRQMFTRFYFDAHGAKIAQSASISAQSWKAKLVQKRLDLKSQVGETYNKLLAHLRWSFLALEQQWLDSGLIQNSGDIFLLRLEEIMAVVNNSDRELIQQLPQLIAARQQQWHREQQLIPVPKLVYGQPEPSVWTAPAVNPRQKFQGIGASLGQIEGVVQIVSSLGQTKRIDHQTIIVVPYTDAGWSPILARAGGLISEVGGRLSHGAIVAREYNIPAVMDVTDATKLFHDGQRVRIDGQTGIVEILE
ncbi:glycerol-3-phosphate acyltransferase [Pleurocapsales cyanobacterium LEGE 10410]|nr:glycerol-3-phosphate acyltransferase [Pleurocapsales cyanobacterium LEGE 10410]